jgi:hypothetical protein
LRHQAVEQDVVHHERHRAAGLDHLERLGMAVGRDDVHAELLLGVDLGDLLDVGGAGGRDDGLALEIGQLADLGRALRDEAVGGDEVRGGEPDLLLARQIVGGRAALQVDGAVRHQRDAVGRGDQLVVDLEVRHLQLVLHRVDDLHAQVHRIADRLLLVVVVGEGNGSVAVADGDGAGILDFLQRAFLRGDWQGNRQRGKNGESAFHESSWGVVFDYWLNAKILPQLTRQMIPVSG